ncbi:MAG: succinylglutamate desuccinylase/aspartoacylase family protein [bacterium]|nr:succinylglutamate desuccinylase/aspartoacylase family protein [bacterium]
MNILGTEIRPGRNYQLSIDIAHLHTRTKIDIPVIIRRARKSGPCVLITAGIHGDEVNGVEIVRQLIANKYNVPEAGTIICVPVINPFGFIMRTREFPDGRDLNRVFPGALKGSLASRVAHELMTKIVPHADYCIDYHTGGAARFNYSQLRISNENPELLKVAKAFGAPFIKYSSYREKSYRESATKLGKQVLLFEGGKALHFDREVTRSGVDGTLNVLHYLGMRSSPAKLEKLDKREPVIFSESTWVRSKHSGMYRSLMRNGRKVHKGDIVGTITDPYGAFERKVKATADGYIICLNHSPIVTLGDALLHIAMVDES